jgi:dTDP-4-amino-4,6-dideoxygalactose transaminase
VLLSSETSLIAYLESTFGVTRALIVNRAALGLVAALDCWRRRHPRCRVAVSGAVCHDVVVAIIAAGCEIVFCDIDIGTGLVRDSEWARARASGADVALLVHLYGNPARVGPVRALFPPPDCLVIDDAAQALGTESRDGGAGAGGDVGLLSFMKTKHLPLGNAALLFADSKFCDEVESLLRTYQTQPAKLRDQLVARFRSRLDHARARLCEEGEPAWSAFQGLLEGMDATLFVPRSPVGADVLLRALQEYPIAAETRVAKAASWASSLSGTGLNSVGMGPGSVPWRYVCRLPGLGWGEQWRLSEAMRSAGMDVSNWYLPAHWFLGHPAGSLPSVERLSREVFEFWVDESVTHTAIARHSEAIRQIIGSYARAHVM